jgi:hypothetical protein
MTTILENFMTQKTDAMLDIRDTENRLKFHRYLLLIFFISNIFASCGNNKSKVAEGEVNVIDVVPAMENPTTLKASDYFKSVKYIPLETTDNSLIDGGSNVNIIGDKIVVSSREQCLVFEKETGKFITSVGRIGQGPEEYTSGSCWTDELYGKIFFLKNGNKDLVCYGTDGKFVSKIPGIGSVKSLVYIGENLFAGYYDSGSPMHKRNDIMLAFFDMAGDTVKTIFQTYNDVEIDPSSINSITGLIGESNEFGPAGLKTVLIIEMPDAECVFEFNESHLWRAGEKIFFKPVYNDTVFQIVDKIIFPRLVFNFGAPKKYNERFLKKAPYVSHILESKDIMLFRFPSYDAGKRSGMLNAVYNKQTGKTTVNHYDKGIEDDITHFLPLQPYTVSSSGEYIGLVSAIEITEWFEKNDPKSLPKEIQQLKNMDFEDNPVIVVIN